MKMTVHLNLESAAVLLRCLAYGESAISSIEHSNGIGAIIEENVGRIRKQICSGLATEVLMEVPVKKKRRVR